MNLVIKKVDGKKELNQFIKFPHQIYADDPNYVPELNISVREKLNKKKNPFFEHSEVDFFLAYGNNKVVGRIAAIRNNNYNIFHHSNVGFFGFFDVIDNYSVAEALLQIANNWNKSHGFDRMLGPVNFSTNETAGMLVEGYDSPPQIQMTYNKPYYNDFLIRFGFGKEIDMFAYYLDLNDVSEKSVRFSESIRKRLETQNIIFRKAQMNDYKNELKLVKKIYDSAWEKNWGFVPPTSNEFDYLAHEMKMVMDPEYCYFAEKDGQMIGFALGLPDINEILIKIKNGRLLPFGIFKLLWGRKKLKSGRILLLGVIEKFRRKGIEAVFFSNFIEDGRKNNMIGGEASWILENNEMMVKAAESLNGKKYKTYRIYSKNIC